MPPVTGSKETVLVSPSTSRISFSRAHWSQQGRAMCTGICCLVLLYHPVEQAGCMVLSSAIWPHVLLLENDFFMLTIPFFLLASKCRVCTRTHHHPFWTLRCIFIVYFSSLLLFFFFFFFWPFPRSSRWRELCQCKSILNANLGKSVEGTLGKQMQPGSTLGERQWEGEEAYECRRLTPTLHYAAC